MQELLIMDKINTIIIGINVDDKALVYFLSDVGDYFCSHYWLECELGFRQDFLHHIRDYLFKVQVHQSG